MKSIVAKVQTIEGKFFAKDLEGNISQLREGDLISQDMVVFGDKNNATSDVIEIVKFHDKNVIVLNAVQKYFFNDVVPDSYEDGLNYAFLDLAEVKNNEENEEKPEDILDETEAGDEKVKESESGESQFAQRDGNIVDVNSDLRSAKFKLSSHDYEIKSQFENESQDRLLPLRQTEPERPIPIVPTQPPVTPPPVEITFPEPTVPVVPTIVISDAFLDEANGVMVFTVTSSVSIGSDITFNYISSDETANKLTDYAQVSGIATIKAGQTTVTISVPIKDDFYNETDESFTLNLSNMSVNATIKDAQGIGIILDNEPNDVIPDEGSYETEDTVYVKLFESDSVVEGEALSHSIKLVDAGGADVMLKEGESITVTLTYTPNGSSQPDSTDYTAQTTVTILGSGAGNNTAIISNPTLDNVYFENSESYTLSVNTITDNANTFENVQNEGSVVSQFTGRQRY